MATVTFEKWIPTTIFMAIEDTFGDCYWGTGNGNFQKKYKNVDLSGGHFQKMIPQMFFGR